jgi:hypothetical protein
MAIKPLKLKSFVSEEEAAQLLSQLIGEEVSSDDMAEYAASGIVPAYIAFPSDGRPGKGFYLLNQHAAIDDSITNAPHMGDCTASHLPYPFKPNWRSMFVDTKGNFVAARIEAADGSLVPVEEEQSYPRIYAPAEICQVAQILNDPTSCPEWPAVTHAHGPMWIDDYGDGDSAEGRIVSPHDWHKHLRGNALPTTASGSKGERRVNWPLIVAAMWEELRDEWRKQGTLAEKIGERGWKGARKDDVNHALSKANRAKEEVER